MKVIKAGRHRLFENDSETARVVSEMLRELERDGMDAVRRYSQQFDQWSPSSFELSDKQVASII
jgi:sulfopropanediol 3-dehydrogenase